MIRILFICHGNICRSTMAQSVMTHLVRAAGRGGEFLIDSAATTSEELGRPPHPGTVAELARHDIPAIDHRARKIARGEDAAWDHIVYMDRENERDLARILGAGHTDRCSSLLSWCGITRDVADPWYTGDFSTTYDDVAAGCAALLEAL